jgi:hypothetical protein
MAIKHVKETLGQFQDWKYFSILEAKEEKEDKKLKDDESKDGMGAIKKLRDNLSRFETASGGKILKYKEFWEENQTAASEFDESGDIYKLWDSDYVAGVLNLPDEALTDDEINAQIEIVDQAGGDDDDDEETTDDEKDEEEVDEEDEDEKEDEEKDEKDEEDEEEEEEIEEGNAFGNSLRKAKKAGKKDFKVGKKKFPVKEGFMSLGESFSLFEAEEEETEEEEVEAPEAETEEGEESGAGDFKGFDPGDLDGDLDGDGKDEGAEEDVEVEDGEAIELDGDLDGDGTEEGGMEFSEDGEVREYFVIYDMSGSERDEVFRTDDPKVIQEFRNFFENEWKATVKAQIQQFKQAQDEKRKEAEAKAKEELRAQRKGKLDKFLKESRTNEAFDFDQYEEPYVLDDDDDYEFEDDEFNTDADDYDQEFEYDNWKEDLVEILADDYGMDQEEAENIVKEENPFEAFQDQIPLEDVAAGIYDRYNKLED